MYIKVRYVDVRPLKACLAAISDCAHSEYWITFKVVSVCLLFGAQHGAEICFGSPVKSDIWRLRPFGSKPSRGEFVGLETKQLAKSCPGQLPG